MEQDRALRICFFGDYDPGYARNRLLIGSLRRLGAEVVECRVSSRLTFWEKATALRRLYRTVGPHDALCIGFTDTRWLPLFCRLFAHVPIVFDIGFALYDAYVLDRKLISRWNPKAWYHWALDFISLRAADLVIVPTNATADDLARRFRAPHGHIARVPLGADTAVFAPHARKKSSEFIVEFHGKYIPVQGVDVLLRAAKLLESESGIRFVLIGDGQEKNRMRAFADELGVGNVTFLDFLPQQDIAAHMAAANVCIGLLGDNIRAHYSVPNKVYEAAAMERVSINADSEAIREFFTDGENIVLVPPGDPEAVADAIVRLKADPARAERLESAAYRRFLEVGAPEAVGKALEAALRAAIHAR